MTGSSLLSPARQGLASHMQEQDQGLRVFTEQLELREGLRNRFSTLSRPTRCKLQLLALVHTVYHANLNYTFVVFCNGCFACPSIVHSRAAQVARNIKHTSMILQYLGCVLLSDNLKKKSVLFWNRLA